MRQAIFEVTYPYFGGIGMNS